jgi:hypothetical protein
VVSVNGVEIRDPGQLHDFIYANLDTPVEVTLRRGGETVTLTATPSSSRPSDQGALGISMGPALVRTGSVIQSVQYGAMAAPCSGCSAVLLPAQRYARPAQPRRESPHRPQGHLRSLRSGRQSRYRKPRSTSPCIRNRLCRDAHVFHPAADRHSHDQSGCAESLPLPGPGWRAHPLCPARVGPAPALPGVGDCTTRLVRMPCWRLWPTSISWTLSIRRLDGPDKPPALQKVLRPAEVPPRLFQNSPS